MLLVVVACSRSAAPEFQAGIDILDDRCGNSRFFGSEVMSSINPDFVIYHYNPHGSIGDQSKYLASLAQDFAQAGTGVVLNLEAANFFPSIVGEDGFDYANTSDSLHRFVFPDTLLTAIGSTENIIGLQYDEIEHCQINRNISLTMNNPSLSPVSLAETTGMGFLKADSAVFDGVDRMVTDNALHGVNSTLCENVWPVLFHNFARGGMIPVYKQMKENWSDIYAVIAAGASLQYGTDLWACLDFWRFTIFPGHSAEELEANLKFAYWMGVDNLYVESYKACIDKDSKGNVVLNERGQALADFISEYVKKNPRPYSFRDYRPEIAIIRFDDTYWGQGPDTFVSTFDRDGNIDGEIHWDDTLFGARDLKADELAKEWLKAWNTITHGQIPEGALSYNAENVYGGKPYRGFAAMNSPIVFDHLVRRSLLKPVELAFLCGRYISEETLNDVRLSVKRGMTVVTSPRFAPAEYSEQYFEGTSVFKDGRGKWIITDNISSREVKDLVRPFLGDDDEITLRFRRGRRVRFKISEDGKCLSMKFRN